MGARTPTSSATLVGSPSFLASVSSTSPPSLVLGVKALTLPLQSEGLTRLEDVLTHHSSPPDRPPQTRELGPGGSSAPRSPLALWGHRAQCQLSQGSGCCVRPSVLLASTGGQEPG